MEIRPRREEDVPALAAVAARIHSVDSYPIYLPGGDVFRFLTRPMPMAAWVAVVEGELLGHVALNERTSRPTMALVKDQEPVMPPIYVARLLVDPRARRRGLGRHLLDHARRVAVDKGRSPYLDVVDVATAAPAVGLYRREGWQEIGRVRFELGGDSLEELVFQGPTT